MCHDEIGIISKQPLSNCTMLSAKEAESIILDLVRPLNPQQDIEIVGLENGTGRILAKAIASDVRLSILG